MTTDAEDTSEDSPELFTPEDGDLEIITMSVSEDLAQNNTESEEESREVTQEEATEEDEKTA